jgi:hypothetical protein
MSWFKSNKQNLVEILKEEQVYEVVAYEISNQDIRPGLWAKAFSSASGDEDRARAIYIKLRADQVKLGNDVAQELIIKVLRQLETTAPTQKAISTETAALVAPVEERSQIKVTGWDLTCKFCSGKNVEPPNISSKLSAYCYDCNRYLAWGVEALSTSGKLPKKTCRYCQSTNLEMSGEFYVVKCKDCGQRQ